MAFSLDQIIRLPELADHLGLTSPEFRVDQILKGGMGECIRIVQDEMSFALKVIRRDIVEDTKFLEPVSSRSALVDDTVRL